DPELAMWHDVPSLVEAAPLGQRPELSEALAIELDFGLLPGETLASLRREHELVALAPQAHLAIAPDREIALLDLIRLGPRQIGRLVDQELPLDLHGDTVEPCPSPGVSISRLGRNPNRGARGMCGLR